MLLAELSGILLQCVQVFGSLDGLLLQSPVSPSVPSWPCSEASQREAVSVLQPDSEIQGAEERRTSAK